MPFAGRLVDLVTHDMRLAKNLAFARLKSNSLMITDVGRHLFSKGGKSLRAMLALASARMCGHRDGYHIPIAVAVEFIHAATLLHDDVIDDADLRRGGVSAHKIWGNRTSILAGDFLLGQAFQLMVEVGSIDVLSILSDAAVVIAEAEAMQIAVIENMSITEDEYFSVVCAKTAALFAAAAEVGPALSGSSEREAMRCYGEHLGIAFQLIDDALDYSGTLSNLGKKIGADFYGGRLTFPVILAYNRGSDEEKAFWSRCIKDKKTTSSDWEHAIELLTKRSAVKDTLRAAKVKGSLAASALEQLGDDLYKQAFMEVIDFCINRDC